MAKDQPALMTVRLPSSAASWSEAKLSAGIYQRILETIITGMGVVGR